MKRLSLEDFRAIPKAELHYHLDGSLKIETVLALAKENNVTLPTTDLEELTRIVRVGAHCKSLEEYLEAYTITLSVTQTYTAMVRVAYEALELCVEDGITYAELRFCPALHTKGGMTLDQVMQAVQEGRTRAARELGIRSGVIVCVMRQNAVEESVQLAELAVKYRGEEGAGVVGFDVAGPEKGFAAALFAEAFAVAAKGGLGLTAHAGEGDGAHSVASAITDLKATRIGHGVNMIHSADVMQLALRHDICVEQCITSNLLTKAVPELSNHPAKRFVEAGLCLMLSTDGVTMTDTTLSREFLIAQDDLNFSPEQLLKCIENGFARAFQPEEVRREMIQNAMEKAKHIFAAEQ